MKTRHVRLLNLETLKQLLRLRNTEVAQYKQTPCTFSADSLGFTSRLLSSSYRPVGQHCAQKACRLANLLSQGRSHRHGRSTRKVVASVN